MPAPRSLLTWHAPFMSAPALPCPYRYENTEKRIAKVAQKGLLYMGMGVSGGEEGARRGECAVWIQGTGRMGFR